MTLLRKPKLEEFNKLVTEHGPVNPDLYRFVIAEREWHKARAELAKDALIIISQGTSGVRPEQIADHTLSELNRNGGML